MVTSIEVNTMSLSTYAQTLESEDKKRYVEKITIGTGQTSFQIPDPICLASGWLEDRGNWPDTDYGCIYIYIYIIT